LNTEISHPDYIIGLCRNMDREEAKNNNMKISGKGSVRVICMST
jgi:hypothetical protein